jgi:hypothetical protein
MKCVLSFLCLLRNDAMVRVGPQRHRGENVAYFIGYCIKICQYTELNNIRLIIFSYFCVFQKPQCMLYIDLSSRSRDKRTNQIVSNTKLDIISGGTCIME